MRVRATRCLLALVLAFVFVLPTVAGAQEDASSQAEYAGRVGRALDVVEEAQTELLDARAASDVAARVHTFVPASERVEAGGEIVVTDNSTLRSLVTELDTAEDPAEREKVLARMQAYLSSLDVALTPARDNVPEDPELLEELIAEASVDPSAIQEAILELVQRIAEWLQSLFSGVGESSAATTVLVWIFRVAIAALVMFLAYVVVRVLQRWRRQVADRDTRIAEEAAIPIVAAAEGLPDDALGHADELAEQGEYREAVRALYGGAARSLIEAAAIRQSRTLTAAELIAATAPEVPEARAPLMGLSSAFELAWYGHRDPGPEGYARARDSHLAVVAAATRASGGGEAA
jgi:hypothetical protein